MTRKDKPSDPAVVAHPRRLVLLMADVEKMSIGVRSWSNVLGLITIPFNFDIVTLWNSVAQHWKEFKTENRYDDAVFPDWLVQRMPELEVYSGVYQTVSVNTEGTCNGAKKKGTGCLDVPRHRGVAQRRRYVVLRQGRALSAMSRLRRGRRLQEKAV